MSGAAATFVLSAGGTGGHLFPAQALAEALTRRGHRIVLMTDTRGATWSDRFGRADILTLPSGSPSGGLIAKAAAAIRLVRGGWQARRMLKRIRPAAVVGFGGYAAFPAIWAARRLRLSVVLHEQNAHLGRVNRVFAAKAQTVALSFAETRALPETARSELTGNPVRPELLGVTEYAAPKPGGPLNLLVFGGSQGARVFSDVLPGAIADLPEKLRSRVRITQQVRAEDSDRVRTAYAEGRIAAELSPFFDDMAARLSEAHLVVARAGASTCAELAAAGRPAVLVPYPFAADDHQSANAAALTIAGGAWTVPNENMDRATCTRVLTALLEDPATLATMAAKAKTIARPDAAERLADLVEQAGGAA